MKHFAALCCIALVSSTTVLLGQTPCLDRFAIFGEKMNYDERSELWTDIDWSLFPVDSIANYLRFNYGTLAFRVQDTTLVKGYLRAFHGNNGIRFNVFDNTGYDANQLRATLLSGRRWIFHPERSTHLDRTGCVGDESAEPSARKDVDAPKSDVNNCVLAAYAKHSAGDLVRGPKFPHSHITFLDPTADPPVAFFRARMKRGRITVPSDTDKVLCTLYVIDSTPSLRSKCPLV